MLKLTNLHKTFNAGTVNEKKALDGLNFDLADGDFATIVGSNGAGKSTMFNAITGAFFVEDGAIELDGKDITFRKEHLRSKVIGHLFQDPMKGTAPHMTTMSRDQSSRGLPLSRSRARVNTVVVVFRLRMDLPMIKMLMVYRPVLTMIPARMLSTPSLVWSRAVRYPERMPAPMAAKMARIG